MSSYTSYNTPSTPSRTRRSPTAPSSLHITFVSTILDVVVPARNAQFIEYGSVCFILLVGASVPPDCFNWERTNMFFRNTELCITVLLSGDLSPWGIRMAEGSKPEDTEMYDTIMMTSEEALQTLSLNVPTLNRAVQTQGIPCDFVGRVCGFPGSGDTPRLTLKNAARPLLEVGFFVNLQFWLRRQEGRTDDRLRKGSYHTYVYVVVDNSARKRFGWVFENGRPNLAVNTMIHCIGIITGQIKEEWIETAGYENGTPVKESPIFVILPTGNIRLAEQSSTGPTIDMSAVSSPPTETFMSKLERARAMHNRGQGPSISGSQQSIDLTSTGPDNDSDATVNNPPIVEEEPGTSPTPQDSPSMQLTMNPVAPETEEHNEEESDIVDKKKRRRRL